MITFPGPLAVLAAVAVLSAASSARAADRTLAFLTPADIVAVRLLPPPPVDGSAAGRAEVAELHAIAKATSPQRWAQAQWDNDNEDGTIFGSALAPASGSSPAPHCEWPAWTDRAPRS